MSPPPEIKRASMVCANFFIVSGEEEGAIKTGQPPALSIALA